LRSKFESDLKTSEDESSGLREKLTKAREEIFRLEEEAIVIRATVKHFEVTIGQLEQVLSKLCNFQCYLFEWISYLEQLSFGE
jgi:septal ring factor EnvC (AmiA/AmiB activator)